MPILGFQNGTYKFDNELDKGVLNIGYGGAKAGLNLGFVYLGVEYLESLPRASSDKRINPQDKVIYPVLDGNLTSIGPTLGIELGRVLISGSYFIIETAKKKGLEYGFEKFDHTYHGTGVKVGVGYRLWKNAFFELNAHKRTYDKFSSKYSGNFGEESSLTSKLSATTFGFSFFYIAKAEDLVQFK